MLSIIVKKRTVVLVALGLIGLVLLLLGWQGDLLKNKEESTGTPVSQLNSEEVVIENNVDERLEEDKASLSGDTVQSGDSSEFFVEYRLERERTRGQSVEWLREVMNNSGSSDETRQKAQEHLMKVSRSMTKEVELENLIKAKGYTDAAVFVDDQSVTVIVATAVLTGEEAGQISELVARGTGVEAGNIVIVPKN